MKIFKYINTYQSIKREIKISLFLAFLTLTSHLLPLNSTAYAADTMSVSPIIINVPLSPGKTYQHEITVHNLTNAPLPLKASLNDFQTTGEEGGYLFEESRTNPLLSWIKLSETDLILNPKEQKRITMTIHTPQSIPLGGYYGMLFLEPVPQNTDKQTTHIVSKIGVLLLANIGVPDPKAKKADIVTFSTGFFHQDGTLPLLLRVKNVSLHFFTTKPILTISPLFTLHRNEQPLYLEEKIIFQGKIRRWEQPLTTQLPANIYKAHLQISTGNGQYVSDDSYFVIFPWSVALVIVLLLIVLLFLISKRGRIKKSLKILLFKLDTD